MLSIKNTKVYGIESSAIRSGFPKRWDEPETDSSMGKPSQKDVDRLLRLSKAPVGSGHNNALKGITVYFDMKYSLYFTKQLQRYHFIDVISSQSTMHTITKRRDITSNVNRYVDQSIVDLINGYIDEYNNALSPEARYHFFMKIISNLPSGFQLWAGYVTNYLQLVTIYKQRANHKLQEDWGYFCNWIEGLPLMKEILKLGVN